MDVKAPIFCRRALTCSNLIDKCIIIIINEAFEKITFSQQSVLLACMILTHTLEHDQRVTSPYTFSALKFDGHLYTFPFNLPLMEKKIRLVNLASLERKQANKFKQKISQYL